MRCQIVPMQFACCLASAALADRKQAAEAGISRAVGGVNQDSGAVGKIQPAPDDQAHVGFLRALMRADDAGERIAIGDAQRGQAEHGGLREQFLDVQAPRRKE